MKNYYDNKKKIGGLTLKKFKKKFYHQKPLISIITCVLNGEKYLEETILSIRNQTYKNYEYIVVDGDSSDSTLSIIKRNEDIISYWQSEKDEGLYFGFNKGLNFANGDLIVFVNSDDILTPNALQIISDYYNKNPDIDFIFGSVKKHWGILCGYKPWKIYFTWGFYSSHSTGFYITKNAAKKVGYYNTVYKFSADYDYFYRMIVHHKLKGISTKKNELVGIFRRGGFSSKVVFFDHFMETIKIRLNNRQNKIVVLMILILKFIKNLKKL
jgi:glycosyltransferase involved in cell wall biosynthesis